MVKHCTCGGYVQARSLADARLLKLNAKDLPQANKLLRKLK